MSRVRHFELRLQKLRLMIALTAATGLGVGISLLLQSRRLSASRLAKDGVPTAEWYRLAQEQIELQQQTLTALVFFLALALIPVAIVMRGLQSFVLAHRLDLAARDQAMAAPRPPG